MSRPSSPPYGAPRIGVVLSGWPRVSETFALNELLALEAAGLLAFVASTKPGDDALVQPGVARLKTPVHLLAEGDTDAQAVELAGLVDGRVDALHGYFAHRPAQVANEAARRLSIPFGFSAHALDVRKVDRAELHRLGTEAACVVACNHDTVRALQEAGAPVRKLAHGVDTRHFGPTPVPAYAGVLELLSVGRLVEKKGFPVLLEAVALLTTPVRLRIVGDGAQRPQLESLIARLGIEDRVELLGRRTHAELPALISAVHVVVVPSIIDERGDRDGLPNVVLEAMASARPVVASDVAAIADAVRPDRSGVLVPPGDALALAEALLGLASAPERLAALGRGARELVETEFELTNCTDRFVRTLEAAYG